MAQKMPFCFTNISAKILQHILGYSICTEHHILVPFCLILFRLKRQKLSAQKLLSFGIKKVSEVDSREHNLKGKVQYSWPSQ